MATTKDGLTPRLQFLNHAAHLMAPNSLAVAAHMKAQCDELFTDEFGSSTDKAAHSRRRDACNACGTPFIPGFSCSVSYDDSSHLSKGGKKRNQEVPKSGSPSISKRRVVYSCHQCNRHTVFSIETAKPAPLRRKSRASLSEEAASLPLPELVSTASASVVETSNSSEKMPASVNASSKKRAKARKGGLQAMLMKSKQNAAASSQQGFGLDLMDLMQSG